MPVINTPTVNIALPVPQPVQTKPKQPRVATPQPVAQPQPQSSQAGSFTLAPPPPRPMTAVILPWTPGPKRMSRLPKKVIKFAAASQNLRALLREAYHNPYETTLHGAIADALEEEDPNSPFPELIRRQHGLGNYMEAGPQENLWYDPVQNAWDGTFPYTARLGKHGPFNLYLAHEGGEDRHTGAEYPLNNSRWVVHAVAPVGGRDLLGYSFEFPHEEAHLISRIFPAAAKHINGTDFPGRPGENHFRDQEARTFDDRMDEEERQRDIENPPDVRPRDTR